VAITAGAVVPLDEKRRRRHDLLAQLREVDHWRRLVAARLDLAVAAVTSIDEPDADRGTIVGGGLPAGLREILGLPDCTEALPEASTLLRLRAAQRDLDEYARALRESTDLATMELATLLDAERVGRRTRDRVGDRAAARVGDRAGRRPAGSNRGPERWAADEPHLHVVGGDAGGHPAGPGAGKAACDGPSGPSPGRSDPSGGLEEAPE
jgi:hypothetical protein